MHDFISFYYGLEKLLMLLIISFSLKDSLKRLKNHSPIFIKWHTIILNIYVVVSTIIFSFNNILNIIYKDDSLKKILLRDINVWIGIVMASIFSAILISRFIYAKRNNFPAYKLLLYPIIVPLSPFVMYGFYKLFNGFIIEGFIYGVILLVLNVLMYINYFYLIYRYTKPFEIEEYQKALDY